MTKPVNIYTISRIKKEYWFSVVETHDSNKKQRHRTPRHEMGSLFNLRNEYIAHGFSASELGGFFYGYTIPHIGKEFDLLRITADTVLSIELKSQAIPTENIKEQLVKNRHYLSHTGRKIILFTVVTDSMTCYRLTDNNGLVPVDFSKIAEATRACADFESDIDRLFKKGEYLVSPFTEPEKFISGEYFLTQAQDTIRKELMKGILSVKGAAFYNISGNPGTGKTLLMYHCAKLLCEKGKVCIVHCGRLNKGQETLNEKLPGLTVITPSQAGDVLNENSKIKYIFVDESQRIYLNIFEHIVKYSKANKRIAVFSSDSGQILTLSEAERNMTKRIENLGLSGNFYLSERVRANKELQAFIDQIKDLSYKPKYKYDYDIVNAYYAYTYDEAENIVKALKKEGYVFVNYTKADGELNRFKELEDFSTSVVIGREFDKVVMLMDSTFYYDNKGILCGVPSPSRDYLYPNMFYQGITRARENLAVVTVNAPKLFEKIVKILAR